MKERVRTPAWKSGDALKILTDIRSGQDAGSPHGTMTHREQLLGFTGQLKDTNTKVHVHTQTKTCRFIPDSEAHLLPVTSLPLTYRWSFTSLVIFRHKNNGGGEEI